MDKFPLPSLLQHNFTEYFDKEIPRRDTLKEKIIYPGEPLGVSCKSRSIKRFVEPKNVFITVMENGTFNHRLLGSDGVYAILPKRLHSVCFPKIHLGSIPHNNRIRVKISPTNTVTLPFVPDDFYKQKQAKSERPNKPITRNRGTKRNRTNMENNNENIEYKGWNIYNTTEIQKLNKNKLITAIQDCIRLSDNDKIVLPDPFENIQTLEDGKDTFKIILQFIYHYAREEFGLHRVNNDNTIHRELWDTIKN
tara:strand:- start:371 stop:1123 length:753 start_codon:yes stop_codon:yes gene_type:complete